MRLIQFLCGIFATARYLMSCIVILSLMLTPCAVPALLLTAEMPGGHIAVSAEERPFSQGDTIKLTLQSPPFTRTRITFNGRMSDFIPAPEGAGFFTLLGIGCEMNPGDYPVTITIEYQTHDVLSLAGSIGVIEKKFRTERFRVKRKYIQPPPEAQERIRREQNLLRTVYGEFKPVWHISGRFVAPVKGKISGEFGARRVYAGVSPHNSRHRGIDITAPRGTPVKASNGGTVVLARSLYYTGNTVILHHGNRLFSLYCHMSDLNVQEGASILKGTVVGHVGSTGRSTGPHLHWGVRIDNQYVDPDRMKALTFD